MTLDHETVTRQLGREPRGRWRAASRCRHGAPTVIATRSDVDGEPFPTLFWLTCPYLCERVSALESEGAVAAWTDRLEADAGLAEEMRAADEVYRRLRQAEAGGVDRCWTVGIAGQRDSLKAKCIHAHVAAFLGGIDDPIGRAVLAELVHECDDSRCMKGADE